MDHLRDRLVASSDCYDREQTALGVILVGRVDHEDEFTGLVRHLLNCGADDFVVLPVTNGIRGYERVILLPITDGPLI